MLRSLSHVPSLFIFYTNFDAVSPTFATYFPSASPSCVASQGGATLQTRPALHAYKAPFARAVRTETGFCVLLRPLKRKIPLLITKKSRFVLMTLSRCRCAPLRHTKCMLQYPHWRARILYPFCVLSLAVFNSVVTKTVVFYKLYTLYPLLYNNLTYCVPYVS